MQPHFLSCHCGDRVSKQCLNDLMQFYLHPIIRQEMMSSLLKLHY